MTSTFYVYLHKVKIIAELSCFNDMQYNKGRKSLRTKKIVNILYSIRKLHIICTKRGVLYAHSTQKIRHLVARCGGITGIRVERGK